MKKFLAIASATLMLGSALLTMAGCANKTFRLSEHAVPADGSSLFDDTAAYTKATLIEGATSVTTLTDDLVRLQFAGGCRVYDPAGARYIGETYTSADAQNSIVRLTSTTTEGGYTYAYLTPAGDTIVSGLTEEAMRSSVTGYLAGEQTSRTFYTLTYTPADAQERVVRYFTEIDEQFREVESEQFRTTPSSAITAGAPINGIASDAKPVADEDLPSSLSEYTVSKITNDTVTVYYVYRNGEQTCTFSVQGGQLLGYLDHYALYTRMLPVDPDAEKGYNVAIISGSMVMKYMLTYHRIDLNNGKEKELSCDYMILNAEAMYNYAKEEYDFLYADGAIPFVDGVATLSVSSSSFFFGGINERTVVLNSALDEVYDATQSDISLTEAAQIADGRYVAASSSGSRYYLLDGEMNVLANAPFSAYAVYREQGLIVGSINGNYLAVDFDGNVVLEDRYDSLNFYGSAALTYVDDGDEQVIVTRSHPEGRTLDQVTGGSESESYAARYGAIVRYSITGGGAVYTYEGNKLTDFASSEIYEAYTGITSLSVGAAVTTSRGIWLLS